VFQDKLKKKIIALLNRRHPFHRQDQAVWATSAFSKFGYIEQMKGKPLVFETIDCFLICIPNDQFAISQADDVCRGSLSMVDFNRIKISEGRLRNNINANKQLSKRNQYILRA